MSTFIIRNKDTLQQWVANSGKRAWSKSNHAKAVDITNNIYNI